MGVIIFHGWKEGFEKVEHTKLLRKEFGFCLRDAKAITDLVLAGESVAIEAPNDRAEELVQAFRQTGVECKIDEAEESRVHKSE